jgi:hypothetical protein
VFALALSPLSPRGLGKENILEEKNDKTLAYTPEGSIMIRVSVVLSSKWLPDEALKQDRSQ